MPPRLSWQHAETGRVVSLPEGQDPGAQFYRIYPPSEGINPFTWKIDMMNHYTCPHFEVSLAKAGKCMNYLDRSEHECGLCSRPDMYRCIQDLRERPLPLSHSSVQDFLTCHHYYYLSQIRGIEMRPEAMGDPLKEGSLWNAVLDYHLSGKTTPNPSLTIEDYQMSEKSVAKIKGLFRAWKDLEITIPPGSQLQKRFDHTLAVDFHWLHESTLQKQAVNVKGFYDRLYPTPSHAYFIECKLTKAPDRFQDIFFISSQVGTYFLVDPSLEYVIMEIVRNPDLKVNKNENMEDYGKRVYEDVMTRAAHYFIGWNRENSTFGKKFLRSEFNLKEIEIRYEQIVREIYTCLEFNGFYKNDKACAAILPGIPCPYLNLCRYNMMSETVYRVKLKEERI
jgi:hypothetical protein